MNYAETENLIQARKREDGKLDTSEDGKPDTCMYYHARMNLQHQIPLHQQQSLRADQLFSKIPQYLF